MELENNEEKNLLLNEIKTLYESFLKTFSRFVCNDIEIIVLEYLIEKAKEGELEINDEKLVTTFKFDKNSMTAALTRLSKSKFIEMKEKNLAISDGPVNPMNFNPRNFNSIRLQKKKTEKYYKLSPHIKRDFPPLLEKLKKNIEKDLRFEYVCPDCKKNYKTEDVFETNPKLEKGRFLCLDSACRSYLIELTEEEIRTSNDTMKKILEVLSIIQSKYDLIKDKEWPFKKKPVINPELNRDQMNMPINNNGERENFKVEGDESNRESWAYKIFKNSFFEKYKKHFDYLHFTEKEAMKRKLEINKKLEEAKKKLVHHTVSEKYLNHIKILDNRKRFAEKNDFDYDKLYKILKK